MLGLGIALSVAKGVIDEIGGLLSKLARRSTYSENLADSRAIVSDIDSYNLLDKATILLTPTATSDAKVHSVKTYTGDELVSGGTFTTQSDVDLWTGYNNGVLSLSDGRLLVTPSSSNSGRATQGITTIVGHTYILSLNFENPDSSNVLVGFSNNANGSGATYTTSTSLSGSFNFYYTATATTTYVSLSRLANDTKPIYYDNVSVVDVSSDFDFDRASSATRINSDGLVQDMQSITDPELVLNGDFEELGDEEITNGSFDTDSDWTKSSQSTISNGTARILSTDGSFQFLKQSGYTSTQGKTVKITIDIVDVQSGQLKVFFDGGTNTENIPSTVGTHTVYLVNDGTVGTLAIARISGVTDITIDNVSVKQVDPNDRWTVVDSDANNYVEFTQGFARLKFLNTSPITTLNSTLTLEQDKTYELVVDVYDVTSGSIKIDAAGISELFDTEGVTTRYITPTANTTLSFYRATANVDVTLASVSVKDVTFSTDVDLARINYDSNGQNGHILLEPTSTNLLPYSEDFSEWTADDVEVANNATTSPNGDVTATLIKGNTNTSRHNVAKTTLTNTVTASFSVFAKAKELRYLQIASANSTDQVANFDLLNGTIGTIGAGFSDVVLEEYPNDWYRISLVSLNRYNSFYISLVSSTTASWLESWAMSNNTDGLYIWGAQLEELSHSTSYIPTLTGSTVTRATETLTGSGNSTLINSTEGVLYAEIAALANSGTVRYLGLNDGSSNNRVVILNDGTANRIRAIVSSGGTKYADLYYNVTDVTDFHKVAVKYKANDFALWIDGVERATDTSGSAPIGLNDLDFELSGGNFYGKCKALAVFNEALEDDELELLTGVTNYGSFGELASANGYTII